MERKLTFRRENCLKNRLTEIRVHYLPFYDLKDAILSLFLTVLSVLIYRTKILCVLNRSVERHAP
nr:conserved hypothetical protein [Serratia symbiotica]